MLWQFKYRILFKGLCILTLIGFSPSAVAAWNFIPMTTTVVLAQQEEGAENYRQGLEGGTRVAVATPTEAERALARLLGEEELERYSSMAMQRPIPAPDRINLDALVDRLDEEQPSPQRIQLAQADPPAPGAAADLLASADAALASNDPRTAALLYIDVLDDYPGTAECKLANLKLTDLEERFEAGEFTEAQVNEFVASLPTFAECKSAESKYTLVNLALSRGKGARIAMGEEVADQLFASSRDMAWQLIQDHPNEAIVVDAITLYYEAAELVNDVEAQVAFENLYQMVKTGESSVARWAARATVVNHSMRRSRDVSIGLLQSGAILAEADRGVVEHCLADENVYDWVKALILIQIALAHHHLHQFEESKSILDDVMSQYPNTGWPSHLGGYSRAFLIDRLNIDNPNVAVAAYQAYVDAYPDSPYAPRALNAMATVYLRGGDYEYASDVMAQVLHEYPESRDAADAFRSIEYIERNGYVVEQLVAEGREQDLQETEVAQNCGPYALQKILAELGIAITVEELATAAGTDDEGTTMAGLVAAAEAHGVSLLGVTADDPTVLPVPYIAFVNQNHFVLVNEASDEAVRFEDISKPNANVPRIVFDRMWDGKALVVGTADGLDSLLNLDELKGAKGGSVGVGGDTAPQGVSANCPNNYQPGCPPKNGSAPNRGHETSAPGHGDAIPGGLTNGSGMSSMSTGIRGDGVGMNIVGYQSAQQVNETDISIRTVGGMKLSFGRNFFNWWGLGRARYQDSTNSSMENVIGYSWTHNFHQQLEVNDTLVSSMEDAEEPPISVVYVDHVGNATVFNYAETTGGYTYYTPQTDASPSIYSLEIRRDTTTHEYFLDQSNGDVLAFSEASTDSATLGWCRLEALENSSGATMDLEYDSATIGTGKLTKVTTPSGDARFLELSYDTTGGRHLITKAALKDGTGELKSVSYDYAIDTSGVVGELTKVTYGVGEDIHYAYASELHPDQTNHNGEYVGRYISKVTDKADNEYDIAMSYAETSAGDVLSYGVEITHPSGLVLSYERDTTTGSGHADQTLYANNGTSDVRKMHVTNGPHGIFISTVKYYDSPGVTTGDTWTYYYNTASVKNALTKVSAGTNDRVWQFEYASNGMITRTKQGADAWINVTHGTGEFYPSKRREYTLDTNYYYDTATTDPGAKMTKMTHPSYGSAGYLFFYDSNGQLTKTTDPDSNDTTYAYDSMGNMTSTTNALSQTTTYYYDKFNNMTRMTDPGSNDTYYYYDTSCGCSQGGKLTKVKDPGNNETEYFYDTVGNLTKITDALSNDTLMEYDDNNLLTKRTEDTNKHFYTYRNVIGQVTKTTDEESTDVTYEYNNRGWVTKVTDPVDYIEYEYDVAGDQTLVRDGLGQETDFTYTDAGRVSTVVDHLGDTIDYNYDGYGRLLLKSTGLLVDYNSVLYAYSSSTGQLSKVSYTQPDNPTITYDEATYHYNSTTGRLTKVTDWIDGTTGLQYAYDDLGRLTQMTDYDSSTLTYSYDSSGRVTSMNDYHSNVTSYTYNSAGRLSTLTAPGSKVWTYSYNALGQPTSVSNPNGSTTTWGYDGRNRLTKTKIADGATTIDEITYSLDDVGNVTSAAEHVNGTWSYGYDGRDRLTSATLATSGRTRWAEEYVYDDGDNILTKKQPMFDTFDDGVIHPEWTTGTNIIEADGMIGLSSTSAGWQNFWRDQGEGDAEFWFSYRNNDTSVAQDRLQFFPRRYNSNSYVLLQMRSTGMYLNEWDGTTFTTLDSDTTTFTSTEDQWYDVYVKTDGANIDVYRRERGDDSSAWALALSTSSATQTSSTYAQFGIPPNMDFDIDDFAVLKDGGLPYENVTYAYSSANQLTTMTTPYETMTYAYDDMGRQTSKTDGTYTADYIYRYDGMLYDVDTDFPGESDVTYSWDSLHRCHSRTSAGTLKRFKYDVDFRKLNIEDDVGDLASTRVHYPVNPTGICLGSILGPNASTGELFENWYDGGLSVRRKMDSSVDTVDVESFSPFGTVLSNSNSDPSEDDIFATGARDSATNLINFPFRTYSSYSSRWSQKDPIGYVDGPNAYEYVNSSPTTRYDTLGLESKPIFGFVFPHPPAGYCTPWQTIWSSSGPWVSTGMPCGYTLVGIQGGQCLWSQSMWFWRTVHVVQTRVCRGNILKGEPPYYNHYRSRATIEFQCRPYGGATQKTPMRYYTAPPCGLMGCCSSPDGAQLHCESMGGGPL